MFEERQHMKQVSSPESRENAKYLSLFEQASDAIMVTDLDGNFTEVNANLCRMFGYTKEELLQLNIAALIDPVDISNRPIPFDLLKKGEHTFNERRMLHRDGHIIYVEANVKKIDDYSLMAIARDVTLLRDAQRRIAISEANFRGAFEHAPIGMALVSLEGKWLKVNNALSGITGYSQEELLSLSFREVTHPEDRDIDTALFRQAIEGKIDTYKIEKRYIHKDGRIVWINLNTSLIRDDESQPLYFVSQLENITEKKRIEEQVFKEKELSDTVINSLPGVFFILSPSGHFLRWNKNFESVSGYSASEIMQTTAADFILKEDLQKIRKAVDQAFRVGHAGVEITGINREGMRIPFFFTAIPFHYEGEKCLIGTGIDISSRLAAELQLSRSEAHLQIILNTTDTGYILVDRNLHILSLNQQAVQMGLKELGFNLEVGKYLPDYFLASRHPIFLNSLARVLKGTQIDYVVNYPQVNGTDNWYEVTLSPIKDAGDEVLGLVISVNDITERLRLEKELEQQKLKTQQEITAAVITAEENERNVMGRELHDNINQVLAGALMYLSLYKEKAQINDPLLDESYKQISFAINEIRSLSHSLISPFLEEQLLTDAIDNIAGIMMRSGIQEVKTSFKDFDEMAIPPRLKIAIYRIVQEQFNNILKYAHAKRISLVIKEEPDRLLLTITDDGEGFNPEAKSSGIGLLNIRTRASLFNGTMAVRSAPGKGCELQVIFRLTGKTIF